VADRVLGIYDRGAKEGGLRHPPYPLPHVGIVQGVFLGERERGGCVLLFRIRNFKVKISKEKFLISDRRFETSKIVIIIIIF